MHHLILVRENDQQMTGSGCCGRVEFGEGFRTQDENLFPGRREEMTRVGEIYRAVRDAFGDQIEISILDPRNQITFLPLVVRDAVRYRVPLLTTVRTIAATNLQMGVLDGQVLYTGCIPTASHVVDLIAGRLDVHRVGSA